VPCAEGARLSGCLHQVLRLMLCEGADVNARGNDQSSALILACEGNYIEIVK
jgi:hypothetical protein